MQRLLLALLAFLFLTASSLNDARKANSAFERGDYREAAALYRQAILQDPDNPRLHFNLGNALYHLGEQDQAFEAYQRFQSLTDLQQEQSLADYNKGRMLTDQENYEEALDHFRQALIRNPGDADAQHNFELASRRLQEQQEQQQEQQEPDSGEQDQDDQNEDQDEQQPPQPDSDQQSDENEDSGEQPSPLDMTPEEAEAILDALEQLERELLENQKKESSESQSGNERDW